MKKIVFALALSLVTLVGVAQNALPKSKAPEGARSYIISPANGEVVGTTVKVQFGLSGMGIAPAGVKLENTGHHHLLLDLDEAPDFNIPLPASNKVIHFGKGQTETILKLKPGKHTLQLILGDYLHIPHDKPVISEKITIHVKE
ncbi:MAG: DUF4399 domain-containing protein [Limisphaerales bacterium]|nr:rod shape-determining protein RodA [Pedosphaera sp.]MBL6841835.1 DUF4399 domain-containing protein [Verrucomicrobiae bacterium]RZO73654.1 MAG: DUF4399 domain-containing protein [Limisphaerales bacterium]HAQ97987.1 rod shape-determining protein RodA [Verrucomicrobiales bacterium]HAW01815.1 rod shape-determining protein RodA [Verrucomicrobiales bacterium]|tara:strand:+ start:815 stop:1246 length:432 start_codon:yes stop_codon:yes gene_type:complete